jgi:N-acetylmuramoyl-L-alanine amidase
MNGRTGGRLGDWGTGGILRRLFSQSPSLAVSQSLLLAMLSVTTALASEAKKTVNISAELRVSIEANEEVFLSARPLPGEALDDFARRFTDDPATKKEILAGNAGMNLLRKDIFVRVPYRLLSDNYRRIAMEAIFPADRGDAKGWTHVVASPVGHPESLWRIAEWFTGDGSNYRAIRDEGQIAALPTETGQTVRIPARLLLPAFRSAAASASAPGSPLEYGEDEKGRYAVYRLKKGEALYTSVVIRFTGRLHAEDVRAKAEEIAARNGITDVRAIPADFAIKIPVQDLAPEFRPEDDPARIAEEKSRLESEQFVNRVRAADLSGVTLVLDAGHGGRDTGASVEGVEEARYVYDLACRVQALLTEHTRARVVVTVQDKSSCPRSSDTVADARAARVLTHPPYPLDDAVAGVNLRWYLANSVLRGIESQGGSEDRTVFVSLHADSLHPAVRGLMVYIPGERFLRESFQRSGTVYSSRREVREAPRVSFSRRERIKAEGISRDLAEKIVRSFRAAELPLHDYQPVRHNVIRGGREWVPAILRYNRIPARVLVEVCNLNNPEDRKLLVTRAYRDHVARALVSAIVSFYGGASDKTLRASLK